MLNALLKTIPHYLCTGVQSNHKAIRLDRKPRNILFVSEAPAPPSSLPEADRRDDPYGSIGHYPELHMDIHELGHHEIQSEHEGNFGHCGYGGGYSWCPDGIGNIQLR